jgi:hypothetical protein
VEPIAVEPIAVEPIAVEPIAVEPIRKLYMALLIGSIPLFYVATILSTI